MTEIVPVILCGGSGTRLWPASRKSRPKQFLPLIDGRSPFQETLARVAAEGFARPVVITSSDYRFIAAEQADEAGSEITILLEPEAKDSGPAFAAGAAYIEAHGNPQSMLLALAADHLIRDAAGFRKAVRDVSAAAREGSIVTFGVVPEEPTSAYGYIRPGPPVKGTKAVREVAEFVEKPDSDTATRYVKEGYLWNSGNFLCRADVLLDEYEKNDAETVVSVRRSVGEATRDLDFTRLEAGAFGHATKRSIDYAVMEHTSRAVVAELGIAWSDIGGWDALAQVFDVDGGENAASGTVIPVEARRNIVYSHGRPVVLAGVDDLVIVVTDDAVLVTRRGAADLMRSVVKRVREHSATLAEEHVQSFRPWGNYRSLDRGIRHQVKRIVVKPGARLSLQHHHHRAEHWIVVRGTARVTIDERVQLLHENESVYVPLGSVHRMENPGKIDLEMIEVQTGSYLGEDDIFRHEDVYARS